MLYIFSTCRNLIRTLPALQHDLHRPEDLDTEGEDHAADELRYACMSRPWTRDKSIEQYRSPHDESLNDLMQRNFAAQRREVRARL